MYPLFPFRAFVLPLQRVNVRTLNTTSPFLTCFVLPLQEFVGMYSNLDVPPLSGHAGISPTTQMGAILYKIIHRSRGRQDAIDFVTIAIPSLRSLQVLPPHQNKDNATALSFFVGNGLETKQRQNKKANRRVRFLGWLG